KRQEQELNHINNKIADHTKSLGMLKNNIKYSNAINNYFTKLSNNLPDMKEYCDIAIGLSEHKYKYYNLYSDYNGEISSFLHNIEE
ncbi:hypothetical protein ACI3QN_12940, partial [Propionibacterium freudenreichii]|uniref:hypothetical protein n=1 Tax=Propionibacterium freudenreichii TaxID=1744 RepID=UPI003854E12B